MPALGVPPGPASATHLASGVIGHQTPGLPRLRQTPQGGLRAAGPRSDPRRTHLSLHRELPVLREAEGEAAEDAGGRERGGCRWRSGQLCPHRPHPGARGRGSGSSGGHSPELALDLDPAGAAQEGPGLIPLLHGRQAGAEHLQPQVQDLLAGDGGGEWAAPPRPSPSLPFVTTSADRAFPLSQVSAEGVAPASLPWKTLGPAVPVALSPVPALSSDTRPPPAAHRDLSPAARARSAAHSHVLSLLQAVLPPLGARRRKHSRWPGAGPQMPELPSGRRPPPPAPC